MNCPTCGASRYKRNDNCIEEDMGTKSGKKRKKCGKKGDATKNVEEENSTLGIDDTNQIKILALVMWHLSPIDRLRHLFSNPRDSELMRWWASDGRKKGDGVLHHPSDAQQWKGFDAKYPEFGEDPRNVRFALSTDGMNPFGDRTSTHSMWPILLSIYNLPPWLFMKIKYLLLIIIISGAKALSINIDVFLEPLMQDMKILWKERVEMWDELAKSAFTLRAIIFVTITDYPR